MLRHDAEGYGHEGNSSGTMPKVTDTRENELARCRWLFERGKMLRQDADGFSKEGNSSGKMPMTFWTRENAQAGCRWLFGQGKQLRQDADDFLGEGKCSGADIFYVFYEIAQNQNIFNIFTLLVRILCTFSLYNDVECSL
ncbi:hypothetical protein ACFLSV_03290 [Bacteroidota bacterium]